MAGRPKAWFPNESVNSSNAALAAPRASPLCVQALENMPTTAMFCRLAWSVLGDQLVLANTSNTNICTLTACAREHWDTEQKHYVGHSGAVVVARYSPAVFVGHSGQGDEEEVAVVRALLTVVYATIVYATIDYATIDDCNVPLGPLV